MATIGVDYGTSINLFEKGQSLGAALAGALGGGNSLKQQLMQDQHEKNLAYLRGTAAQTALHEQQYSGREQASKAAADLERARALQGSSNATPAGSNGAAPVIVDVPAARARMAAANQLLADSASDSAQGFNKLSGGLGMMYGKPEDSRTNYALTGGNPSNSTVLGPHDPYGTNATIAIDQAREAAKAQGDIAVAAANVPNQISVNSAKQRLDQQLEGDAAQGPYGKGHPFENDVYTLEPLVRSGQATPEQIRRYNISKGNVNPDREINIPLWNGTHYLDREPGMKLPNDIRQNPYQAQPQPDLTKIPPPGGLDPLPPTGFGAPQQNGVGARPPVRNVPTRSAAPLPVPADPSSLFNPAQSGAASSFNPPQQPQPPQSTGRIIGVPKPPTPPTGDQGRAAKFAMRAANAEVELGRVKTPAEAPSIIQSLISATTENERIGLLQNYMRDPRYSTFLTAASAFTTAALRDESGAAIGKSEFWRTTAEMIPLSTDSPRTLAYKRAQRAATMFGMANEGWGKGSPDYEDFVARMGRMGVSPQDAVYAPDDAPRPVPPPEAIDAVRKNPDLLSQFIQFYGEDAARGALGNGR